MIGDPATRYREDPVRIIRAVRFAAKLSAWASRSTQDRQAPGGSEPLLQEVPQSRLFDEMLKLLQTGHALASIEQLQKLGWRGIYPLLDVVVERADQPFVQAALQDTDRRVAKASRGAQLFAGLRAVAGRQAGWERLARGEHAFPALQDAIDEVFDSASAMSRARQAGGRHARDLGHAAALGKRRAAPPSAWWPKPLPRGFDFMRLRADIGEVEEGLAEWWQEFSQADDARREDLIEQVREEQRARQQGPAGGAARAQRPSRPRACGRRPAGAAGADGADGEAAAVQEAPPAPPQTRRGGEAGTGSDLA
jgi:poly(A) polymerase